MVNMFVGLTDYDWYYYLRSKDFDEINFWRPGGTSFKALQPGDLFLFKLKRPYYAIVGGGFFVKYSLFPINLAWEAFERKNGTKDFLEFSERLRKYREKNHIETSYPYVGCIILVEPFFFDERHWIKAPANWPVSAVVGMGMTTESGEGKRIYQEVQDRIQNSSLKSCNHISETEVRCKEALTRLRLGQGAFRVLVTDTYHRHCAISGEKTLPVLEAAHIRPYADDGPHQIQNGILLRSDIHKLYDEGYLTIAPDFRVEVSRRLNSDFGNGKIYYQYHGQKLAEIPDKASDLPLKDYLVWHNEKVYLG